MMSKSVWTKIAVLSGLLALAACGDGGGVVAPPAPVAIQDQFGPTFSGAFAANANLPAGPIDPQPGDLPPVSLTTDPIDF